MPWLFNCSLLQRHFALIVAAVYFNRGIMPSCFARGIVAAGIFTANLQQGCGYFYMYKQILLSHTFLVNILSAPRRQKIAFVAAYMRLNFKEKL